MKFIIIIKVKLAFFQVNISKKVDRKMPIAIFYIDLAT